MRKSVFIAFILVLAIIFNGCSGFFGYEKYTDIKDYGKIFELSEIRYTEAMELFPKSVEQLEVQAFYFEWALGIVGSADMQFLLSVTYDDVQLQEEIERIRSLADGRIVHDTEFFEYEAYILLLGYYNTSYYALIDGNTVHYVLLQLCLSEDIDIDGSLIPKGYSDFGDVENASYNVYEG